MNIKRTRFWPSLAILILLIWTSLNQFYWLVQPKIGLYSNNSGDAHLNVLLHSILSLGPIILISILGAYFQKKKYAPGIIFKLWCNLLILGIITAVISLRWRGGTAPAFYDSLLPVTRGASPIIAGIMLGYCFSNGLVQLEQNQRKFGVLLIVGLLGIASLFKPNMFGWQRPNMLFYALLFTLGWQLNSWHLSTKKLATYTVFSVSFMLLWNLLMPTLITGKSELWFSGVNSLVVIIPGIMLARCLLQVIDLKINLPIVASFLIIVESTMLNGVLPHLMKGSHDSILALRFCLIAILIIMLISGLWAEILKFNFTKTIANDCENLGKVKTPAEFKFVLASLIKKYWPQEFMVGLSYVLSLVMIMMINGVAKKASILANISWISFVLDTNQGMVLFSAVIIFLFMVILQVVVRKYWLSVGITIIFWLGFTIANIMKIQSRQEPILPSDLSELSAGSNLLKLADTRLLIIALVLIVLLFVGIIFLEIKYPVKYCPSLIKGGIALLCLGLIFKSAQTWNEPKSSGYRMRVTLNDHPHFGNQLNGAKLNGPIIQFMNNIDIEIMKRPGNYSKEKMQEIYHEYLARAKKINQNRSNELKNQTIIFNLSESFADPDRVPGIELNTSPIHNIKAIKDNSTSGIMMSSGYGGGTANMEWMTLTGLNLSSFKPTLQVPYTQLMPKESNPQSIVQSFDYSAGIHPYVATYYNRISNYQKFGFNKFSYLGSKYPIKHQKTLDRSEYLSDETSYANLYDQIKERPNGQFINLITMQNHMPYNLNDYNIIKKYSAKEVSSGTEKSELDNYTTRLHYTDNTVKQFIEKIDALDQPVTIVFYGDHLPGLYGNDIKVDNIQMHETDYFIYSNKYACDHNMGVKKLTNGPTNYVDPQDFIPMVADQTNSKVNWYQALLTEIWQKLPAISLNQVAAKTNNRTLLVDQNGNQVELNSLSPSQKKIWHDYQLVQYDLTSGKHYLQKNFKKVH